MATLLRICCLCTSLLCFIAHANRVSMPEHQNMLGTVQLSFAKDFQHVQLVHDTVMGGRSSGAVQPLDDAAALRFSGQLSLANNGGFASVRFNLAEPLAPLNYQRILLQLAADGRRYQLRLKTPFIPTGVAYVAEFDSQQSNRHYEFRPADFEGRFRGRPVRGLPPLRFADIYQLSIMLADRTSGDFEILLYSIEFSALQSI